MIDLSMYKTLSIPEGNVTKIEDENGNVIWELIKYTWKKYAVATEYSWNKYNAESKTTYSISYGGGGTIQYSNTRYSKMSSPSIDEYGNWNSSGSATINNCVGSWAVNGKQAYYITSADEQSGDATYSQSARIVSNTTYVKGSTPYGLVTSTTSNTYPTNGRSGDYWYVSAGSKQIQGSYIEDVVSVDNTTYPDNGILDGYWYVRS